jgi:hypothetical protein
VPGGLWTSIAAFIKLIVFVATDYLFLSINGTNEFSVLLEGILLFKDEEIS